MANLMEVKVSGLDQVFKNLEATSEQIIQALARALYEDGNALLNEAKAIVPVDLGTLKSLGFVTFTEISAGTIDVTVGFGGAAKAYAVYVHEGTGPAVGHASYFPPKEALEAWANKHVIPVGALQWAIYRRGTRPTKYLEEPFNHRAKGFDQRIGRAVADILK